ncbi:MAG: hypothetical protein AAGC55_23730, partial [Myxococcota bacterium]
MRVSSEIQVGSATVASGASVRVHRCMGAVAGLCEMAVPTAIELSAAPGDATRVAIGLEDGTATVFTGFVDSVETRGSYLSVRALDARVTAARTRVNEVFEEQTSDAIISDLAGVAGVDLGTIAAGVTVHLYVADDGRSVLRHIEYLAELG